MLKIPRLATAFNAKLQQLNQRDDLTRLALEDSTTAYEKLINNVHTVSRECLMKRTIRTPVEDQAHHNYIQSIQRLHHPRVIDVNSAYNALSDFPRKDPDLLRHVGIRRRQYLQSKRQASHQTIISSLKKIEKAADVTTKLNQTFKFIRTLQRKSMPAPGIVLTPQILCQELAVLDHGLVPLIPELDHFPLTKPPTNASLREHLELLQNGTAPGTDHLYNEMVKAAPEIQFTIALLVRDSFLHNKVPDSWHETSIFLLPKKAKPQGLDDMRKITLASVSYKIYVQYLMSELKKYVITVPEYQSGFLQNRSTDDSIFVINRLLETHWNHRKPLYILALDLAKAFDTVNVHKLPSVLTDFGAPAFLTNRIVHACLYERTRIDYNGQQTPFYVKTVGVKQGCPLSPFLFVLIFHHALLKVQEQLQALTPPINLFLGEITENIRMPMLTAYADDLTILSGNLTDLNRMLPVLVNVLEPYGLKINASKSVLMLKSPSVFAHTQLGNSIQLGGLDIPVRQKVTILGVRFNSDMNRRNTIIERCDKTLRVYFSLLKILEPQQLSFDVLVRIYCAALVPIMIYGIRSISFTNALKTILMRREVQMLRGFAKIAFPKPKNAKLRLILKGRTINRSLTVRRMSYLAHIHRAPANSLLKRALNFKIQAPRKHGRPCYSYKSFLTKEAAKMHPQISPAEWQSASASADLTKKLGEKLYEAVDTLIDPMRGNLTLYPTEEQ